MSVWKIDFLKWFFQFQLGLCEVSRFRHSRGFFTTIQNALGIFVGTMIFREVDHSDLIANKAFDIRRGILSKWNQMPVFQGIAGRFREISELTQTDIDTNETLEA